MSTTELTEKIAALPPGQRLELERYIDRLSASAAENSRPGDLPQRIRALRDRISDQYGPFGDSTDDIRELRDHGR